MPITSSPNNTAYCFGGVLDDEEDEDLCGNFFNDCYCLDLEKLTWKCVSVTGKKDTETKSRRRKKQDNENGMLYSSTYLFLSLNQLICIQDLSIQRSCIENIRLKYLRITSVFLKLLFV